MENDTTKPLSKVIRIDENEIRGHLDEMVRGTVEETLNAMLDAEADEMCKAQRYERSPDRVDTRAGSYKRKLHTKAGEVEVNMPKLRKQTFETAIIERYRRRDISIEEAIVQMYLAGVSVRRVEDVTEALWGTRVSSGTVSNLNKKVYKHIERWRTQQIEGSFAYVYLDGIVLKRSWGGEVKNVSVLAAIGVDSDGAITHWNRGAEIQLGIHHSQAINRRVKEIVPELEPRLKKMQGAASANSPWRACYLP